jgi:hypothetical protein
VPLTYAAGDTNAQVREKLYTHVRTGTNFIDNHCVNQMGEGRSPAGCDTLPMLDVLEAQEDSHHADEQEKHFCKGSSPLAWIWEIAPVRTAF